jgi:hypothetical protein
MRFVRALRVVLVPMPVNGQSEVLAFRQGRLVAVVAFETRDGLVTRIHGFAKPGEDRVRGVAGEGRSKLPTCPPLERRARWYAG